MSNKHKKNKQPTFNDMFLNTYKDNKIEITNDEVSQNAEILEYKKNQFYCFNFKYLTKNDKYNFNYFNSKKSNQIGDAIKHISNEMFIVSQIQVKNRQNTRFKRSMTFKEISGKYGEYQFQDDMEIISLHNGDFRIVCFCEEAFSNILYVLAFDWDFSLYNH